MRSYQTLAVVAGVLGLIIIFIAYAIAGSLVILIESFGGDEPQDQEQIFLQIGVSAFLYCIVIIIPFIVKSAKISGVALFVLAIATLISAGGFGIIGFAILIAAGIAGIRWKEKSRESKSAMDLLKERYAKGEISQEEFDEKKKDLE